MISMEKRFDSSYINELVEEMSKDSIISYDDLPGYDLFLCQVIEYLNEKFNGENFTNNIVQNYVKSEVISRAEYGKKKGYTKTHLIQLVLLSYMRPILSTEEIKKVFKLAFNEINDKSDDILSWEETYKIFTELQKESLYDYSKSSLYNEEKLDKIVEKFKLKEDEKERVKIFLLVLSLISKANVIKKVVRNIVNEYNIG